MVQKAGKAPNQIYTTSELAIYRRSKCAINRSRPRQAQVTIGDYASRWNAESWPVIISGDVAYFVTRRWAVNQSRAAFTTGGRTAPCRILGVGSGARRRFAKSPSRQQIAVPE